MLHRSRQRNASFVQRLIGLAIGLALGRGAIFVLQTWLMAGGRVSTTASFGFGFAMLSLVEWIADWGGMVLQSRVGRHGAGFEQFWDLALARLVVAPVVVVAQLLFAFAYRGTDPMGAGIIAGGALIAPIWALNLSGYLDANRKNQVAGALAALSPVLSVGACYWLVRTNAYDFHSGWLIGGAYSLGSLVSVASHFVITARLGVLQLPKTVSASAARRSFFDGLVYCAGEFPSQLYARAVLLIVSEGLSMQAAGIYVYIRQVVSASTQGIMLIKRVELPRLRDAATARAVDVAEIFDIQRPSFAAALSVFAGSIGLRFAVAHLPASLEDAAILLPYFCASIPIWAYSLSLGQAMVIGGKVRAYSAITIINTAVLCAIAASVVRHTGLLVLSMLDLVSCAVQAWVCHRVVKMRASA